MEEAKNIPLPSEPNPFTPPEMHRHLEQFQRIQKLTLHAIRIVGSMEDNAAGNIYQNAAVLAVKVANLSKAVGENPQESLELATDIASRIIDPPTLKVIILLQSLVQKYNEVGLDPKPVEAAIVKSAKTLILEWHISRDEHNSAFQAIVEVVQAQIKREDYKEEITSTLTQEYGREFALEEAVLNRLASLKKDESVVIGKEVADEERNMGTSSNRILSLVSSRFFPEAGIEFLPGKYKGLWFKNEVISDIVWRQLRTGRFKDVIANLSKVSVTEQYELITSLRDDYHQDIVPVVKKYKDSLIDQLERHVRDYEYQPKPIHEITLMLIQSGFTKEVEQIMEKRPRLQHTLAREIAFGKINIGDMEGALQTIDTDEDLRNDPTVITELASWQIQAGQDAKSTLRLARERLKETITRSFGKLPPISDRIDFTIRNEMTYKDYNRYLGDISDLQIESEYTEDALQTIQKMSDLSGGKVESLVKLAEKMAELGQNPASILQTALEIASAEDGVITPRDRWSIFRERGEDNNKFTTSQSEYVVIAQARTGQIEEALRYYQQDSNPAYRCAIAIEVARYRDIDEAIKLLNAIPLASYDRPVVMAKVSVAAYKARAFTRILEIAATNVTHTK